MTRRIPEARRTPRFKLEVNIAVYPRNSQVILGRTVDLSESGISAILKDEVSVGEMVRLEFALAFGDVEVLAMVRHKTAFRYGFQFVDAGSAEVPIRRTCQALAIDQSIPTGPEAED